MRLHIENSFKFLSLLDDYVSRDKGSIVGWSCLIVRGILTPDNSTKRLQLLNDHLQELDGAIVTGANGDLLLFFRAQGAAGQARLVGIIQEALELEETPSSIAYDLANQRESAAAEFERQINSIDGIITNLQDFSNKPESNEGIEYMTHVMDNSKFSRSYRTPMTILLVEDDPVTCRLAGNLLRKDYVLITAASAYEAVVNYLIYAPDLVFLDINLPDESGFSVLEQLTACDKDAYIVMFSGNDGIDNIINARNHGAMGFIAKPFQRDRLRHYLDEKETMRESMRKEL